MFVRVFGVMFRTGFRQLAAYPLALVAGLLTNSVFGLIRASIMVAAIAGAGSAIGGYTAAEAITFAWLGQVFVVTINMWSWSALKDRVRTGDIAVDFTRPVNLQVSYYAMDLGRALFQFLFRGVPMLIVGALTTGLALSTQWWAIILTPVSLLLAVSISFSLHWLINLLSFWIVEVRGIQTTYAVASQVLGGFILPLTWFPDWFQTIAYCTPFPWVIQYPLNLIGGKADLAQALTGFGIQLGWLLLLAGAGHFLYRKAMTELVVQGG